MGVGVDGCWVWCWLCCGEVGGADVFDQVSDILREVEMQGLTQVFEDAVPVLPLHVDADALPRRGDGDGVIGPTVVKTAFVHVVEG